MGSRQQQLLKIAELDAQLNTGRGIQGEAAVLLQQSIRQMQQLRQVTQRAKTKRQEHERTVQHCVESSNKAVQRAKAAAEAWDSHLMPPSIEMCMNSSPAIQTAERCTSGQTAAVDSVLV